MIIKASTALRNDYAGISNLAKETNEPIYITKNGDGDLVVMNIEAFEKRMTVLEGGVASVACSSGMAAITNAFTNILQSGDEIVCSASLYGGSIDLFRDLESFGIKTHYVNNNDVEQFRAATNENTKLYFAETIGNPRLDVTDIRLIADEAHRAGVPFIVDNTVATAYLIKPIEYGADIVVNSTSKYVNGNSNSISGHN